MQRLFTDTFDEIKDDEHLAILHMSTGFDRGYICQSAYKMRRKAKEWMETLWNQYAPYADKNFLTEFKIHFTERVWELYLGATILNRGFTLGVRTDKHPDLDVHSAKTDERVMWIEAIAVNKGIGPDRVPEMTYGTSVGLPDEEMSLRITQALSDKHRQYQARLASGIVASNEPYVIAIERSELDYPEVVPLILQVAYGIGDLTLRIPVPIPGRTRDFGRAESFYQQRQNITKKNGEIVSSMFFLNPAHVGISAVIYSTKGILNVPRVPHEFGESFIIAHNPLATNPLVGIFPFGEEYMGNETGAWVVRPRKDYLKPDTFDYLYP